MFTKVMTKRVPLNKYTKSLTNTSGSELLTEKNSDIKFWRSNTTRCLNIKTKVAHTPTETGQRTHRRSVNSLGTHNVADASMREIPNVPQLLLNIRLKPAQCDTAATTCVVRSRNASAYSTAKRYPQRQLNLSSTQLLCRAKKPSNCTRQVTGVLPKLSNGNPVSCSSASLTVPGIPAWLLQSNNASVFFSEADESNGTIARKDTSLSPCVCDGNNVTNEEVNLSHLDHHADGLPKTAGICSPHSVRKQTQGNTYNNGNFREGVTAFDQKILAAQPASTDFPLNDLFCNQNASEKSASENRSKFHADSRIPTEYTYTKDHSHSNLIDWVSVASSDWSDETCELDRQQSTQVRKIFEEIDQMIFEDNFQQCPVTATRMTQEVEDGTHFSANDFWPPSQVDLTYLEEECRDWQRRFPHLRVVGVGTSQTHRSSQGSSSDSNSRSSVGLQVEHSLELSKDDHDQREQTPTPLCSCRREENIHSELTREREEDQPPFTPTHQFTTLHHAEEDSVQAVMALLSARLHEDVTHWLHSAISEVLTLGSDPQSSRSSGLWSISRPKNPSCRGDIGAKMQTRSPVSVYQGKTVQIKSKESSPTGFLGSSTKQNSKLLCVPPTTTAYSRLSPTRQNTNHEELTRLLQVSSKTLQQRGRMFKPDICESVDKSSRLTMLMTANEQLTSWSHEARWLGDSHRLTPPPPVPSSCTVSRRPSSDMHYNHSFRHNQKHFPTHNELMESALEITIAGYAAQLHMGGRLAPLDRAYTPPALGSPTNRNTLKNCVPISITDHHTSNKNVRWPRSRPTQNSASRATHRSSTPRAHQISTSFCTSTADQPVVRGCTLPPLYTSACHHPPADPNNTASPVSTKLTRSSIVTPDSTVNATQSISKQVRRPQSQSSPTSRSNDPRIATRQINNSGVISDGRYRLRGITAQTNPSHVHLLSKPTSSTPRRRRFQPLVPLNK
ncbi:unnamed protein product [Dicrocoelium dendriticum]|nr:unnamed protein product [Dicrocoelium dendriticum]